MNPPTLDTVDIDTPRGLGRLHVAEADRPQALLLLGHGAGGGVDAFDLAALAAGLPADGVTVALFEQPWRVAGKRVAPAPKALDEGWRAALDATTARWGNLPLVVGGRSAGARSACRCFAPPAVGALLLSFPLHPPGRPDRSRADELRAVTAPTLLIHGSRDPFGSPEELRTTVAGRDNFSLVFVDGATHSFKPTRKADDPGARAGQIVDAAREFLRGLLS